jgi:AcrR family transcriptional regulator
MTKILAAKPRKRVAEPTSLSHETIRTAALRLIDREGLEGFSTRKLGRALDCEAMAIYWYYPSKDALLDAVIDKLMADVTAVVVGRDHDDWITVLRDVAHAYRRMALDHPNAFPLLATRRFASEGTYAFMEQLFRLARSRNIDDRVTARFYRVVSSYCNGFALNELATLHGPRDRSKLALRKRFAAVAEISEWLEPQHLDEMFTFGLELHLAELARATERQ